MTSKRLLDIVLAASALLLLSPILAVVALAVRLTLGNPVFFRQIRPGYLERPFIMYKFRTMRDAMDSLGRPLPDGERLHPLGNFLRRTSLDELPEFWSVLKGDMSVVGPRPLLMRYLPFYTEEERIRSTVRPGITGWAQIHGRNYSRWNERLHNDVWYVHNRSLSLDLTILLRTLTRVLCRRDVAVDANSVLPDLSEERASSVAGGSTCE